MGGLLSMQMRFVTVYVRLEKSNVGQSLSISMPLITSEEGGGVRLTRTNEFWRHSKLTPISFVIAHHELFTEQKTLTIKTEDCEEEKSHLLISGGVKESS